MIGSLLHLCVWICLDIAERCSGLGQYARNPASEHESSLCRVFAYLRGSVNQGLRYSAPAVLGLEMYSLGFIGFSDAAYADNPRRQSTFGYLFKLGGGPIYWKSQKQPIIATSSMESEYVAYSLACREAVWFRWLLFELRNQCAYVHCVLIYKDNKLACP